tara:strand:- start:1987 stop:2934 length:948 start_codon:yes stop_codon:yes gene_type:complete
MKVDLPKNAIGFDTSEDCAVFPLDENNFLIQSVDFFTPIVDDPFIFGQIAATNSLSDIYAMGGTPLHALNIAEFPSEDLPLDILSKIFEGGLDIVNKAKIPILGGHTVKDAVPKYGLVVTGKVNKKNLTLNSTAKPGDKLILTKPLGTGIISTAIKKEKAHDSIIKEAIKTMSHLNLGAAIAMNEIGANACTDVTGFGLLGHLFEMCKASNVSATINFNKLPLIQGTFELAQQNFIPGGTKKNLNFISNEVSFSNNISQEEKFIMADSQTSGGLLISIPENKAQELQKSLNENDCMTNIIIGEIQKLNEFSIYVD